MAFLGYSDDFDLDDDGILRDSAESGGILIDDDGIVRDDFDLLSKHGSSTHWTDSGLGGDKHSSTPSTLRQLDLQSYPSFEDVSRNLDESNVNISDLEASKDDLSFDDDYNDTGDRTKDFFGDQNASSIRGNRSGLSSRSSFDHSLNYDDDPFDTNKKDPQRKPDLFGEDYYRQLQELGVLVDEDDFVQPRDSLQEFETIESNYSRDGDSHLDRDDKVDHAIEDFLRRETNTPTRNDSMDIEMPEDVSHAFENYDHPAYDIHEGGKRTRPNTASSTRTISSRSFPEISPEEALELYTERIQSIDNDDSSIQFDHTQSQRSEPDDIDEDDGDEDDEIFFIPSQEHDTDSPKPAKMPAYDNENVPSLTLNARKTRSDNRSSDGSRSVTPQGRSLGHSEGYSHDSDRSRSVTPNADRETIEGNGYQSNEERNDSLTQVTRLDSRNKTRSESDSFRPDSALSDYSTASESQSARPKNKKPPIKSQKAKGGLAHARSQESFFDMNEIDSPTKKEKGPKRLLPKPSGGEVNQSFKIKSKSTTNIAALGPVKPTHMSLSEIRSINIDDHDFDFHEQSEPKSGTSDVPKGELTKKLKQESTKRQHATQLVQQLQLDYDKLLSKYALAELTIDQMRLGAKISLHANSPTPSQATSGSITSAQHLQMLQLTGAQRGLTSASPQQATPTMFFPETLGPESLDGRSLQQRGTSPALLPRSDSTNSMDSTSTPRGDVEEPGGIANDAEKVKLGLMFQSRNLEERMQSFQSLLGDNQLNLEEQEGVFDKIRGDHEKLRRDYLQSKEDYNVLKRSTAAGADVNFDQEKELEGELFKLGMKFDEIHEKVEENMKEKSAKRQPFQKKRRESADSATGSIEPDPSTENMKKKMHGVSAGDDLIHPREDSEFDKKVKHLHEEYNALMDRYRRLKQMGQSPERDKEIDNLVRKLRNICHEEPDIFKLPPDLQDRADQLQAKKLAKTEKTSSEKTKSPAKPPSPEKRRLPDPKSGKKASQSPAKSYEIFTASETWSLAESMDRWERSKQSDPDQQMSKSRENLNTSAGSTRSFRNGEKDRDGGNGAGQTDSRLRGKDRRGSHSSISSRGRHTPDSLYNDRSDRGRGTPDSLYNDRSERSSRHTPDSSYNDRDSPVPSLPRPQRHDFPDRERRDRKELRKSPDPLMETTSSITSDSGVVSLYTPKAKTQKPDNGSTTSLQDSGISEHEGGATGTSGPNSPLSKLPGPGKFKQMTGRREHDTDSGFIGSMVGSEVSAGNLSSRRQPQQSPLRLRHPGDPSGNQRPSSRQSSRSEDSARATTPRSARSVASSKSSRRTPTKAFPLTESKQNETSTEARSKTPTRNDSRNKSRDQVTQHSRDYTDDSYTTVTESEMSFDSDMRLRRSKPNSRNTSQRNIDKIMEDSEEDQYSLDPTLNETTDLNLSWITSESERPSVKPTRRQEDTRQKFQEPTTSGSKVTKQPTKGQVTKQQANGHGQIRGRQGRSSVQITDDDTTPTMSPTRDSTRDITQDTTQDTYTSDETTPRSVIERERRPTKQRTGSTSNQTKFKQVPPPEVAPPRNITPVKVSRSEVHPKKFYRGEERGPEVKAPELQRPSQPGFVDKGIGSGSDESILASDAETAATRGSVNSQRLKLLTDELGKLREEFLKANQDRQQQPPPQPPIPQPHDQYYDQYFDPTEDPLAFMRGPRRRANSFSGHGERNWDYDWTLPNVNRDGDIPLGYAAADAFATPRARKQEAEEMDDPSKSRGRRRLRKKISQRNSGTQHYPEQNGYESDQSPTRVQAEDAGPASTRVQGHYGYYSPQTVQQAVQSPTQHSVQHQGHPSHLQPGRRVFGSQPNLAFTGYQPPPPPRSTASGSTRSSAGTATSPSRPLRQTLYSYAANPNRPQLNTQDYAQQSSPSAYNNNPRHYANDDIYINDGQTQFIPNGATDTRSVHSENVGMNPNYGVYTSTCPLCGSSSAHTHGEYVYPPTDNRTPVGYIIHDGRAILEPVQVPVYAVPQSICLPLRPNPNPFSSPLPFRIYRAPPPMKPHLFPLQQNQTNRPVPIPPKAPSKIPPTRSRPMAANHDATSQPIILEMQSGMKEREPRTRARSKSAGRMGRIRHYSPDGRVRSRYFVREFGGEESESAESDIEELPRGRSRSVGRKRGLRHGRKYRRVRGETYERDGGSYGLQKAESQPNLQDKVNEPDANEKGNNPDVNSKGDNPEAKDSAAAEDDLNRSLRLVGEIDDLTHKMMNTVGSELSKSKRKKEFGSSVW